MSTQRFPRQRLIRDLARLETEVAHWAEYYDEASVTSHAHQLRTQYFDRQIELERLADMLHDACDFATGIRPLRSLALRVS